MLQGRVGDPTGKNPKGIWVNPLRDIAHCGPTLISVALQAMDQDMSKITGDDKEERKRIAAQMCEYANCLSKFVVLSVGPNRPKGKNAKAEAFKQSGLLDQPHDAHCLFGKWLARTFLGQYFEGIGEALHPGSNEVALGTKELTETVQNMGDAD